jgi:hypothetical protein
MGPIGHWTDLWHCSAHPFIHALPCLPVHTLSVCCLGVVGMCVGSTPAQEGREPTFVLPLPHHVVCYLPMASRHVRTGRGSKHPHAFQLCLWVTEGTVMGVCRGIE